MEEIINKVAESGLITINLEDLYPSDNEIYKIDLKEILFQELILREKDIRDWVKQLDLKQVKNKFVWLTCSADAVIQTWAYMLITQKISLEANLVVVGSFEHFIEEVIAYKINQLDLNEYNDKRIVVKGCSKKQVPVSSFVALTSKLTPIVISLMVGEPWSTVPLYNKK